MKRISLMAIALTMALNMTAQAQAQEQNAATQSYSDCAAREAQYNPQSQFPDTRPIEDASECYFNIGAWKEAARDYKLLGDTLINAASLYVVEQIHYAVALHHLGDLEGERRAVSAAATSSEDTEVPSKLRDAVTHYYRLSGADKEDQQRQDTRFKATQHADIAWAKGMGYTADEVKVVQHYGRPCNTSTYDVGHDDWMTFWYCNEDGIREEAYTFLNGRLHNHFSGGTL